MTKSHDKQIVQEDSYANHLSVERKRNADAWYVSMRLASSLSRSAICAAFLQLLVTAAPAQLRLHDAANDDLAKKARAAVAKRIERSDPGANQRTRFYSGKLSGEQSQRARLWRSPKDAEGALFAG